MFNYSFLEYQFPLQVEVIGGADMYQAVCRDCFKSPVKKSPKTITVQDT